MQEKPDLSKRINDPKMAQKMAYASDELRTFAAEGREHVKELEERKTLISKIHSFFVGEKGVIKRIDKVKREVDWADDFAHKTEEMAKLKYIVRQDASSFSDDELESLLEGVYSGFPDGFEDMTEEQLEKIDNTVLENMALFTELCKIKERRKAVNARRTQESKE